MNIRSVHFRLISWVTGLVLCIYLASGAYTYHGLHHYLIESMETMLKRRTSVITEGMLSFVPERGIGYVKKEIDIIMSPEKNNRFVRVSDTKGNILYHSGMPEDHSFDPGAIPKVTYPFTHVSQYEMTISAEKKFILLASPVQTPRGAAYIVEVGQSTASIDNILNALTMALILALPFVIFVAAVGGYILVKKALIPVEQIRSAAEKITLSNLKKRLPVVATGDSIEHLSHTLNRMIARLDESYQHTSRFSADASHELRTPLTIMRGELESIILDPQLPKELYERIGSILEETERLASITEGLFAVSRLDAGEARMEHVVVDLTTLTRVTLEQMQLLADEKNLTTLFIGNGAVKVEGDPARLKQVIVNLLDNAIKYTPEGGTITLSVYEAEKKAFVEINDNGIGIAQQDLPYIFDRFYRADKVRTRNLGGAGLGLAIVRSICIAHQGDIQVQSTEGLGSKFTMRVPL